MAGARKTSAHAHLHARACSVLHNRARTCMRMLGIASFIKHATRGYLDFFNLPSWVPIEYSFITLGRMLSCARALRGAGIWRHYRANARQRTYYKTVQSGLARHQVSWYKTEVVSSALIKTLLKLCEALRIQLLSYEVLICCRVVDSFRLTLNPLADSTGTLYFCVVSTC